MSEHYSLEDRNYANDPRVRARDAHRWYSTLDEKRMVALHSAEYQYVKTYSKFKFEVCPLCNGKGSHVNPSVDASGITAEDMYDMDMEAYMDGDYDVECYQCYGRSVVPVQYGDTWTEQDNWQAIRIAFGLARIMTYRFDLPIPPCEYGHNNCSCDGLHGGTCWDETYQELKAEGLIDQSTDDVWIPEGMNINVHTIHAVIANLCSEYEDTGEELTVEMQEAMDASSPDKLSKAQRMLTQPNKYSVISKVIHAASDEGATTSLKDEGDTFIRVDDLHDLNDRLQNTGSQTLCITFPAGTFRTVTSTRLFLTVSDESNKMDVLSDWSSASMYDHDRAYVDAWFEATLKRALSEDASSHVSNADNLLQYIRKARPVARDVYRRVMQQ